MHFFTHRRRGSALLISLLFIFSLCICIPVSAREVEYKFFNWSSFANFYTVDSLSALTMYENQRVNNSGYLRLRFQPSQALTSDNSDISHFLLSSRTSASGLDLSSFNNAYASFIVEYEFYTVVNQTLTGSFLSGFTPGEGSVILTLNGSTELSGVLESSNVVLDSSSHITVSCIYSFFIPSSITGFQDFTSIGIINDGVLHLDPSRISSGSRVRVYYNLYPIIFSTGGQPLTGDELHSVLDEYMHSNPSQPDYSSIAEQEAAEQALAEALPDLSEASSNVLSSMQDAMYDGGFISAMHGIRYMLEEATNAGFLKFLLQFSVSLGAIAFLIGLSFTVIRRS